MKRTTTLVTRLALLVSVLGLVASIASGGSGPVPDGEVEAMIAVYRDRMADMESPEADMHSDSEQNRQGGRWLDFGPGRSDDYQECPKFLVMDPTLVAKYGSWLSMGTAVEAAAKDANASAPPAGAKAKGGAPSHGDLAKKSQNPISDLISVPFESNFNFGAGPGDDFQYIMNVKPVIPFKLNEDWNLITRTIVPIVYNPRM
jgi:hypothetical protein